MHLHKIYNMYVIIFHKTPLEIYYILQLLQEIYKENIN